MQEQLKDEIVITEINGKPIAVTFWTATAEILQNFWNKDAVIQREKKKDAAKLLKTKIKEMKCRSKSYPYSDKIRSLKFFEQIIPTSLRLLLENIITSTNKDLKVFDLFNSLKRAVFTSFLHKFDWKSSTFKCFCCM